MAESCGKNQHKLDFLKRGVLKVRICSMMVIYPEITFALHGQRHPTVLCQSCIHLGMPLARVLLISVKPT